MFSLLVFVAVFVGASCAVVPELYPAVINPALHLETDDTTSRHLSRIINGDEAIPGEFPHQLSLRNRFNSHICGAALIHQLWAVTAAHCVDGGKPSQFSVYVNLHDMKNDADSWRLGIDAIIMHPGYGQGSGAFPNDIALLRLPQQGIDLNPFVVSVANSLDADAFDNSSCVISGWGLNENGAAPDRLQKATVTALDHETCVRYWGSRNILTQHICVKGYVGSGQGSCNGDSGGPLTCNGVLAGVTSWGRSGCHESGKVTYPSVYARISYFYSWLSTNCGDCV